MPMLCLAGTFRIVGSELDGDSIRFYPDDPSHWSLVPGPPAVHTNASGGAQLRLDAIDALETHYAAPGAAAAPAADVRARGGGRVVALAGLSRVTRDGEEVAAVATPDARPGSSSRGAPTATDVAWRSSDAGRRPAKDAISVHVNVTLLRKTANHRLIATGLAYPTFYLKLYPDLRTELTRQAQRRAAPPAVARADGTSRRGASASCRWRRSPTTSSFCPSSSAGWSTTCS